MTTVYGFSIAMKLLTLKLTVAVKLDVAGIDRCIIANLWKVLDKFCCNKFWNDVISSPEVQAKDH